MIEHSKLFSYEPQFYYEYIADLFTAMQNRDILQDQIQQFAKALGKVLADFLGTQAAGNYSLGVKTAEEDLKKELDIDANMLLQLNKDKLKEYLATKNLNAQHIDLLAQYLQERGEHEITENSELGVNLLERSLLLLAISEELSQTVSFVQMDRKALINKILSYQNQ